MYLLKNYLSSAKQVFKRHWDFSNSSSNYQEFPDSYLNEILSNWDIGQINFKKNLGGSSAANWLLETPQGKYVLRNSGTNRQYIDFQILVINKLAESNFEYSIPQILPVKEVYYAQEQENFWLLYRFIESRPLGNITNKIQAKNIGALVAKYHKIAQGIDFSSYKDYFNLQIFHKKDINVRLQKSADLMNTSIANNQLENLFKNSVHLLLEAYNSIPDSDIEAIKKLPKIPVYNDWHGYNILGQHNKIMGLIDFDSLVEATRIVDFQNALVYSVKSHKGIDISRIQSFIQGYFKVLQLSPTELSLIHPLMIERLVNLIADILEERNLKESGYKDTLLIFLIDLLLWMIGNKNEFVNHLFTASSAS